MEPGSLEHRRETVLGTARLVALAFRMRDHDALISALRINARACRCLDLAEGAEPDMGDGASLHALLESGALKIIDGEDAEALN